jgi:hypothetical protein
MLAFFIPIVGITVVGGLFYLIWRLRLALYNPYYKMVDCYYCRDENGKSQGWLELFNDAEYQGKVGYHPATRINGNVIACPVCGATGKVAESEEAERGEGSAASHLNP